MLGGSAPRFQGCVRPQEETGTKLPSPSSKILPLGLAWLPAGMLMYSFLLLPLSMPKPVGRRQLPAPCSARWQAAFSRRDTGIAGMLPPKWWVLTRPCSASVSPAIELRPPHSHARWEVAFVPVPGLRAARLAPPALERLPASPSKPACTGIHTSDSPNGFLPPGPAEANLGSMGAASQSQRNPSAGDKVLGGNVLPSPIRLS